MSEQVKTDDGEFMTGRELRDTFAAICDVNEYDRCNITTKNNWDRLAATIKASRPKTKSLEETYIAWRNSGTIANEASIETLRVLLNEARQKLDGGL